MKIAIIGTGIIGNVHAEALSILGTPASVLCDLDADKAEKVRKKYAPEAKIYTDWKAMLETEKPDAVHICTPHYLHASMTVEALARGVNVLCEKPLCMKKSEIREVLEAENGSKATLGVCHQNRYNAINRFLSDYLADQKIIGACGSVVWERTADYYNSAEWRGTKTMEGGGALINQALHTLDLLVWLCGEPDSVAATDGNLTLKSVIEVEDTIALRCFGQTNYSFLATVGGAASFPVELNFMLEGEHHLLALPTAVFLDGKQIAFEEIRQALGKSCYGDGHLTLIEDYYRSLEKGEKFAIGGEEAAKVMRVILAAYESAEGK